MTACPLCPVLKNLHEDSTLQQNAVSLGALLQGAPPKPELPFLVGHSPAQMGKLRQTSTRSHLSPYHASHSFPQG